MSGRSSKFRDDNAMAIVGIPDIVVLKPVDVDVQPVVGVHVHVGNEEMCHEPSKSPSFEYSPD